MLDASESKGTSKSYQRGWSSEEGFLSELLPLSTNAGCNSSPRRSGRWLVSECRRQQRWLHRFNTFLLDSFSLLIFTTPPLLFFRCILFSFSYSPKDPRPCSNKKKAETLHHKVAFMVIFQQPFLSLISFFL